MTTPHLTKKDFEKKALKSKTPVLIDFFAPWCGPCKLAGPVIDELAKEYKGKMLITKVNIDEEPELAQKHGVMSVPTLIILKDGKEVDRKVGFPGKEALEEVIKSHLK